jgi:uncharacterized protein (DUF58 family)
VLATAAVVAVVGAVAWTRPAPRLTVRREIAPAKVARAEPAVGVVSVTNAGRRTRAGLTALDTLGSTQVAVEVPGLAAGARRTVTYRLPTDRRGEVLVGPLRIVRADPLGLARRVSSRGEQESLLVRPRVHPLPMLPAGRARHLEGSISDRALSGTATFHALREYVPGDDLRHVHWRSSARLGTLMTRELVDASRPTTTIVLDLRPAAYAAGSEAAERFELAVDACASVAVASGRHSHPVRVLTGAGPLVETRGGRGDVGTLLDRLATVSPEPTGTLVAPLDTLRRARTGGLLVVVTGDVDSTELGRLRTVRGRFDRIVTVQVGAGGQASHPGVGTLIAAGSPEELVAGWQREAVR